MQSVCAAVLCLCWPPEGRARIRGACGLGGRSPAVCALGVQEAEEFVSTAVALAMARDGSSGGVIRLVTLSKDGAKPRLITPEQHPVLWDELPEPVGMVV